MSDHGISFPAAVELSDVGGIAEESKDVLSCKCPSCGGKVVFRGNSGVCLSTSPCGFRRGGALDFLASAVGGYPEAIQRAYPDLDEDAARMVQDAAQRNRSLVEFAMSVFSRENDGRLERLDQKILATQAQVTGEANPTGLLFLTGDETGQLFELLTDLDITCPPQMTGSCMVVPYWDTPHSISVLLVYTNRGRNIHKLRINNSKWSWTGLHLAHLEPGTLVVHPTMQQVTAQSQLDSGCMVAGRRNTQASVHPGGREEGWVENHLVFTGTPSQWLQCMPSWSHIKGFSRATFMMGNEEGNLAEALQYMITALQSSCSDKRITGMLGALVLSEEEAARLITTVFTRMGPEWQFEAEKVLSRRLLTKIGRSTLFSTPGGYEAVVAGAAGRLSNFTLKLRDVVGFSLSSELMFRGEALVGATRFDVSLPGSALDSPSSIEKALQSRQILGGGDANKANLATVLDSKGFKDICMYLKRSVPALPRVRGSRQLGWAPRLDEFFTPGFSVLNGRVSESTYVPEAASTFHAFHGVPAPDIKTIRAPENEVLRGITAALVANVVRASMDMPFCPEPAKNEVSTRDILQIYFGALGQTSPARITSILPRYLSVVHGYPVLATGVNDQSASRTPINGVYLGDTGMRLEGTSALEAAAAGQLLLHLIKEVSILITSGAHLAYPERRSVALAGKAGIEGAVLIQNLFGVEWKVPDSRYRFVDLLLEERKEMLDAVTRVAVEDHVLIPTEIMVGVASPDDIAIELGMLCHDTSLSGEGIRVDKVSYSQIYEMYYGQVPPTPAPRLPV